MAFCYDGTYIYFIIYHRSQQTACRLWKGFQYIYSIDSKRCLELWSDLIWTIAGLEGTAEAEVLSSALYKSAREGSQPDFSQTKKQ